MSKASEPAVHIYTLSRLVNARVGSWERKIAEIEDGREKAYAYYQPMREAVVSYCASEGEDREQIVSRMLAGARRRPRSHGQDPERDNLTAFEMFETNCYPKIGSFVRSLLRRPQAAGTPFEGVFLHGSPHFQVKDKHGEERYVFLHSSNWNDEDLKAYLELLGIVVEAIFDEPATSVWHMNLRAGQVLTHRSSKRMRRYCADAARHYARLFAT